MNNPFKEILRLWARWIFNKNVTRVYTEIKIAKMELVMVRDARQITLAAQRKMTAALVDKLANSGLIETKEWSDPDSGDLHIRKTIRVI